MGLFAGFKNYCKYVWTGEPKYAEATWGNMQEYRIDPKARETDNEIGLLLEEE